MEKFAYVSLNRNLPVNLASSVSDRWIRLDTSLRHGGREQDVSLG